MKTFYWLFAYSKFHDTIDRPTKVIWLIFLCSKVYPLLQQLLHIEKYKFTAYETGFVMISVEFYVTKTKISVVYHS